MPRRRVAGLLCPGLARLCPVSNPAYGCGCVAGAGRADPAACSGHLRVGPCGPGGRRFMRGGSVIGYRMGQGGNRHSGPFPEVLAHDVFLNCHPCHAGHAGFSLPAAAVTAPRALRVIGDIACDPTSDSLRSRSTHMQPMGAPRLAGAWRARCWNVMAIDNLPSLLPLEAFRRFRGAASAAFAGA